MEVYNIPHQQISDMKLETETSGVFSCYLLRLFVWWKNRCFVCNFSLF